MNKKYVITLSDGTKIENLRLNGNNFISKTEIKPEVFEGNLNVVSINDGEKEEIHESMDLVQITENNGEWWFVLRDIPQSEIESAKIRADVDFIAMMVDVNI